MWQFCNLFHFACLPNSGDMAAITVFRLPLAGFIYRGRSCSTLAYLTISSLMFQSASQIIYSIIQLFFLALDSQIPSKATFKWVLFISWKGRRLSLLFCQSIKFLYSIFYGQGPSQGSGPFFLICNGIQIYLGCTA